MASMRRPRRAIVNFRGIDHEMNVTVCRTALVQRQVAGEFDSQSGGNTVTRSPPKHATAVSPCRRSPVQNRSVLPRRC